MKNSSILTRFFLSNFQPNNASAPPPPPYSQHPAQQANNAAIPNKRFKPGEEPPQAPRQVQPSFYLSQQQLQMLQFLQQSQNLTPQQQNVLTQLTQQYKLMQQHQQQLRAQQMRMAAQNAAPPSSPGSSGNMQVRTPTTPTYQHPGNRTPQSGTTAQTGFVNDGSFSPATGQSPGQQQAAGMPFKSASAPGYQQPQFNSQGVFNNSGTQISSTTSNQDLGE